MTTYTATPRPTHIPCPVCNGKRGIFARDGRGSGWGDGDYLTCNGCDDKGEIELTIGAIRLANRVAQDVLREAANAAAAAEGRAEAARLRLERFEAMDPLFYADWQFMSPAMLAQFNAARAARVAAGTTTENDQRWLEEEAC